MHYKVSSSTLKIISLSALHSFSLLHGTKVHLLSNWNWVWKDSGLGGGGGRKVPIPQCRAAETITVNIAFNSRICEDILRQWQEQTSSSQWCRSSRSEFTQFLLAGSEFKFQEQRMYSGGLYTESIEWLTEDQTSLQKYDFAPPHSPPPP